MAQVSSKHAINHLGGKSAMQGKHWRGNLMHRHTAWLGKTIWSPVTNLDGSRLGRTAGTSAPCLRGLPGGITMRCQVKKQCQGDPEPAPTGHTSRDVVDEDIGQGGNRQDENPQQWQEPAAVECTVYQ